MLLDTIKASIVTSLKKGDAVGAQTNRFLLSAIRYLAIAKYGAAGEASVTDEDVLDVVKKQVKTHRESVESFEKAGRNELVEKEKAELAILEAMLPKQMSDDEIKSLLAPIATSGETNFGLLMGQAMKIIAGKADGARVSVLLRQLIVK